MPSAVSFKHVFVINTCNVGQSAITTPSDPLKKFKEEKTS
ncbi:hypothetical protein HMPREF0454_03819 [Hafnia alvei ATCC 51873]|uniref:Uncharacterized protein n=1 Tax=Hafnia alvei ATCC 51873 TaxID=1002364 RepID=G9YAY4_HAFAL|nr:hypothetical protein HMPREF0454_03819 [Hafnia alvei ATCC 51873]